MGELEGVFLMKMGFISTLFHRIKQINQSRERGCPSHFYDLWDTSFTALEKEIDWVRVKVYKKLL
jgi:hypothetical protein